jgi:hypothetical protein
MRTDPATRGTVGGATSALGETGTADLTDHVTDAMANDAMPNRQHLATASAGREAVPLARMARIGRHQDGRSIANGHGSPGR